MMSTIFLAQSLGWFFIILGLLVVIRTEHLLTQIVHLLNTGGLFFFAALNTSILGLGMVVSHNVWGMEGALPITLISWLILLVGIFCLFFQGPAKRAISSRLHYISKRKSICFVLLIIGFFLLYCAHSIQ